MPKTTAWAKAIMDRKIKHQLTYVPVEAVEQGNKPVVTVVHNQYIAWFYHPRTKRKVGQIGNVDVTYFEVIPLLKKLGFAVKVYNEAADE